jgi:hypothetical protein
VALHIDALTRHPDPSGVGERWTVTGRLDVLGVGPDFAYSYEDLSPSGLGHTLTVTRDGVDRGYDGWAWGEPAPTSATLIARRVDGEWLVEAIREATVQQVWDAQYDAETAAVARLAGTTTPLTPPPPARTPTPTPTGPPAAAATPTRSAGHRGRHR